VGYYPFAVPAVAVGLAPSGDTTEVKDTANIQGLLNLAGVAILQHGTFYAHGITMTNNQSFTGAGVGLTNLTSSIDAVIVQMGNAQADHIQRNWMLLAGMTVSQTSAVQTHANVKVDGGGRGTSIQRVSSGGGAYPFELMDLDRCYFEDISANNPTVAGIFLEVGYENTYGTVTFVNCDSVLSNSGTYGWYVAPNADQPSPNQPDRLTFIGCMSYMTGGLTGCIGFYDKIGMTSANFVGCLFEQNIRQYRTDGSGSSVNFQGCTFLDSNDACTDIAYLNGSGTFTFRDCRFQQAVNGFNGVSGSPSVSLEGRNNNQGNITNLFAGTFTAKMGTDTVFAGDNVLASGLNNQRFGYVFTYDVVASGLITANAGTDTAGSAPVITPAFANGTPAQLADTTRDYMVYLEVGTAGTALVIKIGPTSTPATTIVASGVATAGEVISVRLPAGWYLEWSATTATLANQTAIGC
jgi:hypothetical protein